MKLTVPDYYPKFHCIAGKCRHSCCIGWEIDIDDDTYEFYKTVKGGFGKRLSENITENDGTAYFRLDRNERCPFLNSDGLCDIILEMGEDSLCEICSEHPRYIHEFSDRTEKGIGLCCEAAAELILSQTEPVRLITLEDDGYDDPTDEEDEKFFELRNKIIKMSQDRTGSFEERVCRICNKLNAYLPEKSFCEWTEHFLTLERLDNAWGELLESAVDTHPSGDVSEIQCEQLLVYFLFRHLSGYENDVDFAARALFSILSVRMITGLKKRSALPLAEIARMYSSEIEYSEDNTAAFIELLSENIE